MKDKKFKLRILTPFKTNSGKIFGRDIIFLRILKFKFNWFYEFGDWFIYICFGLHGIQFGSYGFDKF
jgi:hypothetical protein